MAKYKSIYGPTGVVQLPSGKCSYNGLVEAKNEADDKFLAANSNFVEVEEEKSEDSGSKPKLEDLKVEELKALAAEKNINLGEAKIKKDIIAVIEASE